MQIFVYANINIVITIVLQNMIHAGDNPPGIPPYQNFQTFRN